TLRLLHGCTSLTPKASASILGSIWLQTRHTSRHLSIYRSPNTHVLGEALGLIAAGTLLPGLRDAQTFMRTGTRVFWEHFDRQVAPDGSHREHSTYYHAYSAEMALMALLLAGDATHLDRRRDQIRAMARYLRAQTKPDGTLARMGDDDGGRVLRLSSEDYYAPAGLASVLEALTHAPGWAGDVDDLQDCFWYLGTWSLEAGGRRGPLRSTTPAQGNTPAGPTVRIFGDVGVGIVRFADTDGEAWVSIHGKPMGFLTAGHSHASLMALEMSLAGVPVLVDPGTYRYVEEARREYRSFHRHNVLDVDGLRIPRPDGPFKWSLPKEVWAAELVAMEGGVRATRMGVPTSEDARHERCIRLLSATCASLEDRVTSGRPRQLQYSFHLPPGSPSDPPGPGILAFELEGGLTFRLDLEDVEDDAEWAAWTVEQEWYWMSRRYGQRERAPCVRLRPPPMAEAHVRMRLRVISR
ncbi:MAG: hypothetical protein HKN73_02845, partial [Gemmatimonadetes bacterium]|nr:hypothetical protein [Gemmatimonadota bacterium]